jgi:hypothetical protein
MRHEIKSIAVFRTSLLFRFGRLCVRSSGGESDGAGTHDADDGRPSRHAVMATVRVRNRSPSS